MCIRDSGTTAASVPIELPMASDTNPAIRNKPGSTQPVSYTHLDVYKRQGHDMIRSGNPALKESTFLDSGTGVVVTRDGGAMSLAGTVNKTGLLLLLAVITATYAWSQTLDASGNLSATALYYLWGGAIGGLVLAFATIFKKEWAPVTAPLYALFLLYTSRCV